MNGKDYTKFLLALIPLILGFTIAFTIFTGNLDQYGIMISSNQPIRLDYVGAIASIVFGGILTFELVGA